MTGMHWLFVIGCVALMPRFGLIVAFSASLLLTFFGILIP